MLNGIQKISKLKKFGIYKDFSWGDLTDFKKSGLIYGWNYSGKTTLSKLFQILEFQEDRTRFEESEFKIDYVENNVSKSVTKANITNFPFIVKVFNSDYISRIFTWDEPESSFDPISFYLGDPAGDIDKKIKKLEDDNKRWKSILEKRHQKSIDCFAEYEKNNGKFSSKSKNIREESLPKLLQPHEFNKSKFADIANEVLDDLDSYILSEENKEINRKGALATNTYAPQQENFDYSKNLKELSSAVKSILEDSAPQSIALPSLDANEELFKWVQEGLKFHQDKDECQFCTEKIPENRMCNLNAYYSKKLKEIQASISSVRQEITNDKTGLDINFPKVDELAEEYKEKYSQKIKAYKNDALKYQKQLEILEKDLKCKPGDFFNSIDATEIVNISLKSSIEAIEAIIREFNIWINAFDQRKQEALDRILKHYVAEYLKYENYISKKKAAELAEKNKLLIEAKISSNEEEIQSLNAQLSGKVQGQEELNQSLKILLNRDDIKIEIEEEKFILKRNGYPAYSLSEGEKSAIAFSYFLTELKSLKKEGDIEKTISFIDDPISSLDSNHVFQVRSLISNFFKNCDYCQLFVSTHNFEFFSMLLDSKTFGRINSSTQEDKRNLYFIERSKEGAAIIKKLPKSFSSYKSEYVGLYSILKDYRDLADKNDYPNVLILPNALRRFVELYTLMKYPSDTEVDDRINHIFSPNSQTKHNTKLLHWFSHQNEFEKIQTHDGKILQIEEAINELLTHIENEDKLHWEGLQKVV